MKVETSKEDQVPENYNENDNEEISISYVKSGTENILLSTTIFHIMLQRK
jgi:hypothetical protein